MIIGEDYGLLDGLMMFFFSMLFIVLFVFFVKWVGIFFGCCLIGWLLLVLMWCLIIFVLFKLKLFFVNKEVYCNKNVFVFLCCLGVRVFIVFCNIFVRFFCSMVVFWGFLFDNIFCIVFILESCFIVVFE